MKKGQTFPANDHRNFKPHGQQFNVGETFAGLPFEKGVELPMRSSARARWPDARRVRAAVVSRFQRSQRADSRREKSEQARANARASSLPRLSLAQHAHVVEIYAKEVAPHIRGAY